MERLTKYGDTSHENKVCCTHFMGKECIKHAGHCSDNCLWEEAAWSKLAAYEDTGLEPEEIDILKKYHDFNTLEDANASKRLCELAEADRDGRCIIPPAKIGDTIYHITTCKDFPQMLDGTMYDADGGYGTATGLYCPCELMENCPFSCDDDGGFDCDKHKNTLAIFEGIVDSIHIEDMEDYITFNYSGGADFEDFGKTVFLTREEAEKALRREQYDEEHHIL